MKKNQFCKFLQEAQVFKCYRSERQNRQDQSLKIQYPIALRSILYISIYINID